LKFKSIVITFNAVILLFLAAVFVVPFFFLGRDLGLEFWRSSWFLAPLLILVLAGLDIYFVLNVRVFTLLEKEDWPALVQELEDRVLRRGRYSPRLVKLLANSYLVLSDAPAVNALEKKLAVVKPALINANALIFGAARVLSKDNAGASGFFASRLTIPGPNSGWIRWYYAFSLLLDKQFAASAEQFTLLAGESRDGLITGLSAYFIAETLVKFLPERKEDLLRSAALARDRVKRSLRTRNDWTREVKNMETEVYVVILNAYTGKAADYIYRTV
jgi:hypothetical protein